MRKIHAKNYETVFKFAKNISGFIFSGHGVEDLYFQLIIEGGAESARN